MVCPYKKEKVLMFCKKLNEDSSCKLDSCFFNEGEAAILNLKGEKGEIYKQSFYPHQSFPE